MRGVFGKLLSSFIMLTHYECFCLEGGNFRLGLPYA